VRQSSVGQQGGIIGRVAKQFRLDRQRFPIGRQRCLRVAGFPLVAQQLGDSVFLGCRIAGILVGYRLGNLQSTVVVIERQAPVLFQLFEVAELVENEHDIP